MRSRRAAFSLAFAGLLASSLGVKAAVTDYAFQGDIPRFNRALQASLAAQGFVTGYERRSGDRDLVRASRGTCRLTVRGEPRPELAAAFRLLNPRQPVVRYRYGGTLHETFPVAELEFRESLGRIGRRLGWSETAILPVAIAATRQCDLDSIDFGDQRLHSAG